MLKFKGYVPLGGLWKYFYAFSFYQGYRAVSASAHDQQHRIGRAFNQHADLHNESCAADIEAGTRMA